METNNQNSILPGAVIGKTAGLAAITIFFAAAVFPAFFLFADSASAQDFSRFAVPHAVCQEYRSVAGYTTIRDLTNDCLVRTGDNQTGFLYVHAYNSGNNFCVEMTSSKQGRIFGPQCVPISQTGRAEQQQKSNPGKIVTPPSFQIKELQYDTLPHGKKIQSGDGERIEITMPDGSLIQLDANSTFTPVSDDEVQSVFGRYRYLWQPFHDGKCIVGQNLVRQACRKVKTRDAILGSRGTEFLVETNSTGTTVTVLEGLLAVTDLNGKKTVEVAGGQSTYIKHGGLPADPKPFDPAKIEHWWEKKAPGQIPEQTTLITLFGIIIVLVFIVAIYSNSRKKKLALAAADSTKSAPVQPRSKPAQIILTIIAIIILGVVILYALGQT